MASNPPSFELEDQTDEDFFDKLVNDDDDIVVSGGGGGGGGLKSDGLSKDVDGIGNDGDDFDDVKAFANLSIIDSGNLNDVSVAGCEIVGDDSVGDVHALLVDGGVANETKLVGDLGTREVNSNVDGVLERPGVVSGDSSEQLVEELGDLFGFGIENVAENEVVTPDPRSALADKSGGSATGDVKEVQWSSFSEPGANLGAGFGSYSDFFTDLGAGGVDSSQTENAAVMSTSMGSLHGHVEYQGDNGNVGQSLNAVDTNSVEYWESLYPGWKYDVNTGEWYQVDVTNDAHGNVSSTAGSVQGNADDGGDSLWAFSNVQTSQLTNAQQTAQSVVGTVSQLSTTDYASGQDLLSQQYEQYQYPVHMVFDPQYPGWYYDTIAQAWQSLDAYHSSLELANQTNHQLAQNAFVSPAGYSHDNTNITGSSAIQDLNSGSLNQDWATNSGNYGKQGTNVHQSAALTANWSAIDSSKGYSWQNFHDSNVYSKSHVDPQNSWSSQEMSTSRDMRNQNSSHSDWVGESHSFVPTTNTFQQFNHTTQGDKNSPVQYPNAYYGNQTVVSAPQPSIPNGHHVAYAPSKGRSSAGHPPHALVTFGFGGKLVVMKDNSPFGFSSLASKEIDGHSISVLTLMDVVNTNNDQSGMRAVDCSYFKSLCHQSFPGPLVGGNAGSKELNKWIDDRINNCESLHMDYGKKEALRLLFSLLKVAFQHYGKLRSFGMDTGVKDDDLPESMVAKLFASAKRNNGQFSEYGVTAKCFMNMPSEAQIQTSVIEVQNLLIAGRKKEALQRAQDGQFWGFALILARELGDQFYFDTVKKMAVSQLVVGSPLRTLCLLIAKQPEEVFSINIMAASNMPGAVNLSPQFAQNAGFSMLDNWEENLAVITANRTENDQLVIIHLGDCLWREKNDVTAAHICYLVADSDFELYSERARLCLIGVDHMNYPRTYASPEAIQKTELFEYSKILGNSQFVLLALQPYKLIYAHMLAEVGRISDSLKYCQAVNKSLKTGRSAEADALKQLAASLEDRIRTHQQSGYAANLAPAKIVGKLLTFFDSTAQRVVGGPPPPVPATAPANIQANDHQFQTLAPNVSTSPSVMSTPSLMSSVSMEPISQWAVDGSKMSMQNRSISEPNIGGIPKPDQVDSAKEATSSSSDLQQQSGAKGTSRFGRFGFGVSILQKTVGLLKPRQGNQAKLGDENLFYYDEKLKRWVEKGAEQPAEEPALAPPPTATFLNGTSDYNLKSETNNGLLGTDNSPDTTTPIPHSSGPGIPTIPPSSNQFSARGRMGVRSRYVDTFNKGGGAPTNLFQAPSIPSAKPAGIAAPKFFVPTPSSSNEQPSISEATTRDEVPTTEPSGPTMDPFKNLAPSPTGTMQRFPSVGNIPDKRTMGIGNTSLSSQSRRTASWNDINSHTHNTPPTTSELKASPPQFMPQGSLSTKSGTSGGNFGDDLQEVEL